jgi:transcriptional regulator with XRE-family HTH domain
VAAGTTGDDSMKFADKLKYERKYAGLSQRDLSAITDIEFTYLSKLENDKVYPASEEKISALEAALSLAPGTLLQLAPKLNQRSVQHAIEKSDEAGFVLYSVVNTLSGAEIDKLAQTIRQWQQEQQELGHDD